MWGKKVSTFAFDPTKYSEIKVKFSVFLQCCLSVVFIHILKKFIYIYIYILDVFSNSMMCFLFFIFIKFFINILTFIYAHQ